MNESQPARPREAQAHRSQSQPKDEECDRVDDRTPPDESEPRDARDDANADAGAAAGAPQTDLGGAEKPGELIPLSVRGIFRETWSVFASAWPACLMIYWGATALSWLIINILTLTLASLNELIADRQVTPFLEFLRFVGLVVIPAWLWVGQNRAYLKLARREPAAFDDLFGGGPWLLTTLLALGIVLAFTGIPALISFFTGELMLERRGAVSMVALIHKIAENEIVPHTPEYRAPIAAFYAVFLLSYLVYLAVMSRLGQYPFLILDRDADVLEAHQTSLRWTRGRAGMTLSVYLIQFAILITAAMPTAVNLLFIALAGMSFVLPLTCLSSAVLYQALSSREAEPVEDEE